MNKRSVLNIVALAIVGVLVAGYFLLGPNVVLGGPSKGEIERVTRTVMQATAPTPAYAELAKSAKIEPRGLCNPTGGKYACAVDVAVSGAASTTFVTVMKKGADGSWQAVKD